MILKKNSTASFKNKIGFPAICLFTLAFPVNVSAQTASPSNYASVNTIALTAILSSAITLLTLLIIYKIKNKSVLKAAMLDNLTGLGNQIGLSHSIKKAISSPLSNLYYLAYIGYDDIKLRYLYGDCASEQLQKAAAEIIKAVMTSKDYAAHIENGVFALIYQSSSPLEAEIRIAEINKALDDSLFKTDKGRPIPLCAGVYHMGDDKSLNAEAVFNNAKQAYAYASRNRLNYAFSTEKLKLTENNKERLILTAAKAIENNEFIVYLQFIVDTHTEKICGAEVLSRWNNPEFGLIMPDSYIEPLKETGAIMLHDYNIFEFLCLQLQQWADTKYKNLFLSCNFTRISVADKGFAGVIKSISEKYRFDHSKLLIEVTEDALSDDPAQIAKNLSLCSNMGFKIAIDDMGSGFSSLSDLSSNEIDIVKIDRNLVIDGVNERGSKLLNSLIALIHSVGAKALCEGIETEREREMIRNTACDYTQGYYYSHALSLEEARSLLEKEFNQ